MKQTIQLLGTFIGNPPCHRENDNKPLGFGGAAYLQTNPISSKMNLATRSHCMTTGPQCTWICGSGAQKMKKTTMDSPWVGRFPGKIKTNCLKQNLEYGHISPLLLEKNNTWWVQKNNGRGRHVSSWIPIGYNQVLSIPFGNQKWPLKTI